MWRRVYMFNAWRHGSGFEKQPLLLFNIALSILPGLIFAWFAVRNIISSRYRYMITLHPSHLIAYWLMYFCTQNKTYLTFCFVKLNQWGMIWLNTKWLICRWTIHFLPIRFLAISSLQLLHIVLLLYHSHFCSDNFSEFGQQNNLIRTAIDKIDSVVLPRTSQYSEHIYFYDYTNFRNGMRYDGR